MRVILKELKNNKFVINHKLKTMDYKVESDENRSQLLETEIRAVLTDDQHNQLAEKLILLGAQEHERQAIKDIYYCPQTITSFDQIEMDAVGSYSLRLRKIENQNGVSKTELNVKQLTEKGDHTAWAEYETMLPNSDTVDQMLKIIGFKPYVTIEKTRQVFFMTDTNKQEYQFLIENIQDFGPVLEVESISTRSNVEASKSYIHKFMSSVGIKQEQIAPKSVTNIIMRQRSRF